jgi:putative hydrolase of the HAD superfamily
MLKSIIFDLDETLIDWSGFNHGAWETLHAYHLTGVFDYLCECAPLTDFGAFAAEFRDRTASAWQASHESLVAPNVAAILVETAQAVGVPKESIDPARLLTAYRWKQIEGTVTFPEVVATLTLLRDAGLRFGIVTNAFQPMALRDLELETLGLTEFFPECRFSAADHGYLKPHPSIFQAALDCLGTVPEESVFVGDDLNADVIGAQQAGLFAVYRRSRGVFESVRDNGQIQPDATINDLSELPAVLDAAFPGWRN